MAWFSTIWFHLWWVSFTQSFFFTRLWRTGFLSFLMPILSSRLVLYWICQCTISGCVFSSCWKKITRTLWFWRIWSRGNMNVLLQLRRKNWSRGNFYSLVHWFLNSGAAGVLVKSWEIHQSRLFFLQLREWRMHAMGSRHRGAFFVFRRYNGLLDWLLIMLCHMWILYMLHCRSICK